MNAFIALPAGSSLEALATIFASNPAIQPTIIIEGLGAVFDAPQEVVETLSASPNVACAVTGPVQDDIPVSPVLQPWVDAWNLRFDPAYQNALATRPAKWIGNGSLGAPINVPLGPNSILEGTVALGLITVNGPTTAALSPTDIVDINLSILNALRNLERQAPVAKRLVFVVEWMPVTIGVDPGSIPGPVAEDRELTFADYEEREKLWRDPALIALGYGPGLYNGIVAYRNALMGRTWWGGVHADKAIVGLVTKFNTVTLAYAALGRFVVNLLQTDVSPGRVHIDRVIAHETCHLFGALDEYVTERYRCDPFAVGGPYDTINGNCKANPLATMGQVPCLMAATSDDLCGWSRAHVGWQPLP